VYILQYPFISSNSFKDIQLFIHFYPRLSIHILFFILLFILTISCSLSCYLSLCINHFIHSYPAFYPRLSLHILFFILLFILTISCFLSCFLSLCIHQYPDIYPPGYSIRFSADPAHSRLTRLVVACCLIRPSFACPAQQQGKPLCFYFPAPRCGHRRLPLLAAPAPGPSPQRHRLPLLAAPPQVRRVSAPAPALVTYTNKKQYLISSIVA
jgi:hypothetical protein